MRKTVGFLFAGSFVVLGTSVIAATITPTDRSKTDYTTTWSSKTKQKYTVAASASGCSFNTNKTASTGGTVTTNTSSSAAAEKEVTHTDYPATGSFPFDVHGELAGSGGTVLTWDVDLEQRFFWLSPLETLVKAGTDVTVTANGAPTESTWKVNNNQWKDASDNPKKASSITLDEDLWGDMGWSGDDPPPAGLYTISATTTEASSRTASANVQGPPKMVIRQNGWVPIMTVRR